MAVNPTMGGLNVAGLNRSFSVPRVYDGKGSAPDTLSSHRAEPVVDNVEPIAMFGV